MRKPRRPATPQGKGPHAQEPEVGTTTPKTRSRWLKAAAYIICPFMAIAGLLIGSPVLTAVFVIAGFLVHLELDNPRPDQEEPTDTERTDQP